MAATYTVKQVAEILGYSTNSIYTFLKEKRIKGVRVGRGRFRIPQSELDRLLLTKEGKLTVPREYGLPIQPVPGFTQALPTGVIEPPRQTIISPNYVTSSHNRVDVPSLFDWFVGIGSIVLGLAMFLFSRVNEEYSFQQFAAILPAIRMTLIAGGFGILLTDIVSRKLSIWHTVFHWALVFAYAFYVVILVEMANWEGVVVFGVLMATLILTFFTGIGGIAGFAIYVVGLLALLPSVAVFAPQHSTLLPFMSYLPLPTAALSYVWVFLILGVATMVWLGYMRDRRVFWIGMIGVSILLIAVSMQYAMSLAWGRSLFILITAMLSLFVPVWQSLTFTHKHDRAFIFGAFGTLLVLYVLVVGVLRIMQTNVMQYAGQELNNKVAYGKSLVESTIMSSKTSLSSAATNPLLVSALDSGKKDDLQSLARALFEGNTLFRRVLILGSDGAPLTLYPYADGEQSSYAQTDYFIQATTTKNTVTSTVYDGATDSMQKSVVIAVPVLNGKNEVIGVIAGSLDLATLGNKLQQIASTSTGEYFVVVDKAGKRVIFPDFQQVGSVVDSSDTIRLGLAGNTGLTEGSNTEGTTTLISYDAINTDTGWAIAIYAPVTKILQSTNAANIMIFSVLVLSIFIVSVFLLSHRTKVQVGEAVVVSDATDIPHETRVGRAMHQAATKKRLKGASKAKKPEDTS